MSSLLFLLSSTVMGINNAATSRLLQSQIDLCENVYCEYGYQCNPYGGNCICDLFPDGPKCCNGNIDCRGPCVMGCENFVFTNDCVNEKCSAKCEELCTDTPGFFLNGICCDGKDYTSECMAQCDGATIENCVNRRCNCGIASIGIGDVCCSISQVDSKGNTCGFNGYTVDSCIKCNGNEYANECVAACYGEDIINNCNPCYSNKTPIQQAKANQNY